MSASQDQYIAALLREREGYVAFGKADRVKAVDAELKRRGYEEPKKAAPKERATREQVTTEAPTKQTAAKKAAEKRA